MVKSSGVGTCFDEANDVLEKYNDFIEQSQVNDNIYSFRS